MALTDPSTTHTITITGIVLHAEYHIKRDGKDMADAALKKINRMISVDGVVGELHLTVDSEFIFSEDQETTP